MKGEKLAIIKLNSLLDKILKYNLVSLTEREMLFLDSFTNYEEDNFLLKYINQESEEVFEDFDGHFRFEYLDLSYTPYSKLIQGRLYVPDLKSKGGTIVGMINGMFLISAMV